MVIEDRVVKDEHPEFDWEVHDDCRGVLKLSAGCSAASFCVVLGDEQCLKSVTLSVGFEAGPIVCQSDEPHGFESSSAQ